MSYRVLYDVGDETGLYLLDDLLLLAFAWTLSLGALCLAGWEGAKAVKLGNGMEVP